jgi:hypothetical protein
MRAQPSPQRESAGLDDPHLDTSEMIQASVTESTPEGALVLSRVKGVWGDHLRAYEIAVDGAVVGEIRDGGEVRLALAPGSHQLKLTVDWCSSPKVEFTIGRGQTIYFSCQPNARRLTAVYYAFVRRHHYIRLKYQRTE